MRLSDRLTRALMGFQRWRDLLFVHWEVDLALLRTIVPPELAIDTFDGKAYVGLVPFDIPEVRPLRALPPVPGVARFLETNVRTYVTFAGKPGVWFFSLDAARSLAVLAARTAFGLPYYRADMRCDRHGSELHYTSTRRRPTGSPARLAVRYEVGPPLGTPAPGTLEHFLVERHVLFARHPIAGLLEAQVHHAPYFLHTATVSSLDETMLEAAGVLNRGARTPDFYSPGVDVDIEPPRPAR